MSPTTVQTVALAESARQLVTHQGHVTVNKRRILRALAPVLRDAAIEAETIGARRTGPTRRDWLAAAALLDTVADALERGR